MKRFLPYFRLLKPVRTQFILGLLAALVFGLSSGFGLPYVTEVALPRIFGQAPLQSGSISIDGQPVEVDLRPVLDELTPQINAQLGERTLEIDPDSGRAYLLDPEGERIPLGPPPVSETLLLLSLIPLAFLIRGASGFANLYLIALCGNEVLRQVRMKLFTRMQYLPLSFIESRSRGEWVSRATLDTLQLQNVLVRVSNDLVKQPMIFLGAVGAVIYVSLQQRELVFVLFALGVAPLVIFPVRVLGRRLLRRARMLQAESGELTTHLAENLDAAREIRGFNLQESEIGRFGQTVRRLVRFNLKVTKYRELLPPSIEVLTSAFVAAAVFYAYRSGLQLEQVIPLIVALYLSYEPLKKMVGIHAQLKQGEASLDRIEEILHADDVLPDPALPQPLPPAGSKLAFEGCSFHYERGKSAAIRDITLDFPPGQIVALVGPSGAGKSTLMNLIPRLFDPTEGRVTLGGIDLRDLKKRELRGRISLVSQHPYLFDDTIEANIRVGRPEATTEEIVQAARDAFAEDFISEQPQCWQTRIGPGGSRLSGGQRQRIAIARAFLKDAPILLLDEPTSALDADAESRVLVALKRLAEGRTTLMITHRESLLRIATRVIKLDQGIVVHDASGAATHPRSSGAL